MDSALEAAAVVPGGIFSETGRATEFEISHLKAACQADTFAEPGAAGGKPGHKAGSGEDEIVKEKAKRNVAEESANRLTKTAAQHRVDKAMAISNARSLEEHRVQEEKQKAAGRKQGAQGDLARAIAEKLGQKLSTGNVAPAGMGLPPGPAGGAEKRVNFGSDPHDPSPSPHKKIGRRPTSSFTSKEMYSGPWSSKFTAAHSPGPLNRWNEQRPDVAYYKVQYNMVLDRQPAADFADHPKHVRQIRGHSPGDGPVEAGTFALTGVEEEAEDPREERARRRKEEEEKQKKDQRPPSGGYHAMTPNWDEFGKMRVGRYLDVHYNKVSYPAKDLYQQDIKGYPKQRYPEWNMEHTMGHQPLQKSDDVAAPGKYDVDFSVVSGKVLSGIAFDRALPRSRSDGQLGHFANPAVLHPDETRFTGGVVMDRSRTKDAVRDRIVNVNDFLRELQRPNLPPASHEYHDKKDPVACEITLRNQLTFDADSADIYVTHRRDIAPGYERMLSRGKEAVQGLRALQTDLGVRGSVGLGFVETTGQATQPVERLEGRKSNAEYQRPDIGPLFDQQTQFQSLCIKNNYNHGHPPVVGSGPRYAPKRAPLQKSKGQEFKREVAAKGFTMQASLGGLRVKRQSRAHEALEDWSQQITRRS
mmetsp:Transcript_78967/g.139383  ORF Transcript_78967/g.139383 Transcript_78967/m.139383 type:complete len:643 (-) Transcript_78967:97-2025(-)